MANTWQWSARKDVERELATKADSFRRLSEIFDSTWEIKSIAADSRVDEQELRIVVVRK